ncbi:cytochrome P450-like protein [Tribolium castaneum]|uniref:Cytochrome P450-like protein n=2 Tax=Tribolium castaneum TaxID=7070 RepID=D6X3W8_TRICA|nr:cytochrome P450-like protein [Tribolium castaneum]
MQSTTILVALSAFTAFIYFLAEYFSKKQRLLRFHAAKLQGPPALPLIGSAYYLFGSNKSIVNNVIHLVKKYKSPWKIWLGRQLYIVVTEPEDIEVVLNKALEKAENYNFLACLLQEGLFTGPVEKWKRHRKVILSTFSMPILKSFVEIFSENSLRMLPKLDKFVGKGTFDVCPILTNTALEITCETAMGTKIYEQAHSDYAYNLSKALELVFMRMFQYWLHPNFIWSLSIYSKQLKQLSKQLEIFVQGIVTEKKVQYRDKKHDLCLETKRRKCFIDHLIEMSEDDNWHDHELLEEAQTMVAAGSESLGSVKSFTLIMLGMHPLIQDKVYNEMYNIFGPSDRTVTPDDLTEMTYLDMVIKETLRLFPVTAAVGRRVSQDIVTDRYTLPEGCECIVSILSAHRNPKIWPKPLDFNPDRFLPEEVAKRHPYSYLPFSNGPRNCIGFKYAMMAIKTVISTIVRRYKISTEFKSVPEIEFSPGVVLKSRKGYRTQLESRC